MPRVDVRKDSLITANEVYAGEIERLTRLLPYSLELPEVYEGLGEAVLMRIFRWNVDMLMIAGHGFLAIADIIESEPELMFDQSGELRQAFIE